jgi:hypothetical protein
MLGRRMSQKALYEVHALSLGKLLGNLQSIEMGARLAIAKLDARAAQIAQSQLSTVKVGDDVEVNAFSNSDDLRQTLEKFNKRAPHSCHIDVGPVVDLRDALAHGRTFGSGAIGGRLRLLKFSRKAQDNRVSVEVAVDMTPEWFDSKITMLERVFEKVRIALAYEKHEFK